MPGFNDECVEPGIPISTCRIRALGKQVAVGCGKYGSGCPQPSDAGQKSTPRV